MKYYAVRCGKKVGVYNSWKECESQVKGFSGAVYKSFKDRAEAERFIFSDEEKFTEELKEGMALAYVDGSFRKEDFHYSYGMVFLTKDGEEYFSGVGENRENSSMRNVAGEILGSIKAVHKALESGIKELCICYDYIGIEKWVSGEWQAKKSGTQHYRDFMRKAMSEIKISFKKVKAHSGVKYNEMADKLAKKALGIGD